MREKIYSLLHELTGYSPLNKRDSAYVTSKQIVFLIFTAVVCWVLWDFYFDSIYLLCTHSISEEYLQTYYWLNVSNPTISGMFLSSYSHGLMDNSHIIWNIIGYLLSSVCIVIIWYLREGTKSPIPKGYFLSLFGILYLIGPFVISVCSLPAVFLSSFPEHIAGFSGIVAALFGVCFSLIYPITSNIAKWLTNQKLEDEKVKKIIVFVCWNSPIICIICLIIGYIIDWGSSLGSSMQHNIFGHIGGLLFGFVTAYMLEWYLSGKKPGDRET